MKFDISKIEGYENMTPEEKLKALENYELDLSGYVSKATFDKTASEAAAYKKQLREKQTDDEAKAQKEAEEREALLARLRELEKKEAVSNLTAKYLGLGFDNELAVKSAHAHADGDFDKVFANIKAYNEAVVKKLKAERLDNTPAPGIVGNGDGATITLDAFKKMGVKERMEYAQNHPEEYKKLYGGNN